VIISFKDNDSERVWTRDSSKKFSPQIQKLATRKLMQLNVAEILQDLRIPPGNRLEPLKGNRLGQHSIPVNDQWRISFIWTEQGPREVEIVDYH
jgi:proteic killer suppression protein